MAGGGDHRIPKSILEFLENKGKCNPPLWRKVLEVQAKKRCLEIWNQRVNSFGMIKESNYYNYQGSRRSRDSVMKIRRRRRRRSTTTRSSSATARLEGRRRSPRPVISTTVVENKVRTLKKLIPNGESMQGLDGLFRETADYILALQMRVNLMQIMVKELSGSSNSTDHDGNE